MSVEYMAGRFEGLSDLEWKLFNDSSLQSQKSVSVECRILRFDMY